MSAAIAGDASKWTSMLGMPVEWKAVATSPQLTWIVAFSPRPKSHDPASAAVAREDDAPAAKARAGGDPLDHGLGRPARRLAPSDR